jgi:hypothetical protein
LSDLAAFALLAGSGLRQPSIHQRVMLLATIALSPAALGGIVFPGGVLDDLGLPVGRRRSPGSPLADGRAITADLGIEVEDLGRAKNARRGSPPGLLRTAPALARGATPSWPESDGRERRAGPDAGDAPDAQEDDGVSGRRGPERPPVR